MEKNQVQHVARTACLQNLDRFHEETDLKENAKRETENAKVNV